MYKIRAWAHNAARDHNFNPWSENDSVEKTLDPSSETVVGEPDQDKPKVPWTRQIWRNTWTVITHSWINILLVFVPVGIAVHFANINPNIVFALNAIAIIPLAGLLTFATECVAHRLGPTLGALMNVSFGNAVELIIFIIALVKNEIRIVQASLIGSILANLLLILGMALVIGGLQYQEQIYDSSVTQMSASLLALASLSLLIPTAFHASFNNQTSADEAVIKISRGTSVILLIVYLLYLLFQLKSHSYLYQGTPQHIIDQQTQPGILQRMDSSSTSSSDTASTTSVSTTSSGGHRRRIKKKIRAKLGRKRSVKTEEDVILEEEPSDSNPTTVYSEPKEIEEKEKGPAGVDGIKEARTDPALTVSQNTGTPDNRNNSKRPFVPRGMTLRAPPVFRKETNDSPGGIPRLHQLQPASQLRRLHSAPNISSSTSSVPQLHTRPIHRSTTGGASIGALQPSATGASVAEAEEPPLNQPTAIVLLLVSTALVALCAEFLVGSIEHLVQSSNLSEAFIGLIILPIVGNAAEHVTAVTVAAKNKLDLSMGVSLGSSIQIALFVTPLVVIIGWILDKSMSLYFTLFETVSLFVSIFVVNFLVLDGRSNYLEGSLLSAAYIIIAVGTYFFPNAEQQNTGASGTAGGTR